MKLTIFKGGRIRAKVGKRIKSNNVRSYMRLSKGNWIGVGAGLPIMRVQVSGTRVSLKAIKMLFLLLGRILVWNELLSSLIIYVVLILDILYLFK